MSFEQNENPIIGLVGLIEKVYRAKSDSEEELIKPLREAYIKAVTEKDVHALEKLAIALEAKSDYERKNIQDKKYFQEKGYSWEELDSSYKKIREFIQKNS